MKTFNPKTDNGIDFEPEIGESFIYKWGEKVNEQTLLVCRSNASTRCGHCWIRRFMEDLSSDVGKPVTMLNDKYCLNCSSSFRKDRKDVQFLEY